MFIGCLRAMECGTIVSISARREPAPTALSITASSAASTPMWRAMNSQAFSSSPNVLADCINMTLPSSVIRKTAVAGLIHQRIELGRIGQLDLEEPADTKRVAVGQGRVGTQRFVHLGHFATDRHIDVSRGLDRFDDSRSVLD